MSTNCHLNASHSHIMVLLLNLWPIKLSVHVTQQVPTKSHERYPQFYIISVTFRVAL